MTKVDIELLQGTCSTIRMQNKQIYDSFDGLSRTASIMDETWNGSASQNAMQAFYKLCKYTTPRYNVLENLAQSIDMIASGYTKTEETNVSLANRFK